MAQSKILILSDDELIRAEVERYIVEAGYNDWRSDRLDEPHDSFHPPMRRPDICIVDVPAGDITRAVDLASSLHDRWEIATLFLVWPEDSHFLDLRTTPESQARLLKPFDMMGLEGALHDAIQKHRFHREANQPDSWFASTLRCISDGIVATDSHGCVMFMNPVAERMTGWIANEAYGRELAEIVVIVDEPTPAPDSGRNSVAPGLLNRRGDLVQRGGGRLPIDVRGSPTANEHGVLTGAVLVLRDISHRRHLEREREGLIQELRDAVASIRTLKGLLPICAKCKKVRDDQGYWNQIERYIAQHSDATFTHSICPDCEARYYEAMALSLTKKA
jgi:PAS domain S-box-containing protein